jgi:hypothetical protein
MSANVNEMPAAELSRFLETLFSEGQARVVGGRMPAVDDQALELLAACEQDARLELVSEPPGFVPVAAGWAAVIFYSACQFVVCRDESVERIAAIFAMEPPCARCAATDWSVDVVFRQLPEVFRLARHLSPNDPLVCHLQELAAVWPLSSVGVKSLRELNLEPFVNHPALRQLYADRILATADVSRVGDARVDELMREALGARHELCPTIARALFPDAASAAALAPQV